MSDDTQLTTPEPEEAQPEPVAEPLPELEIEEPDPVEGNWRHQPQKTPPKDASAEDIALELPAPEVVDWHDSDSVREELQPAPKRREDKASAESADPPRPVAEGVQEEKELVRAGPVEPEVASARRASVQSAEEHRQAVRDLHQLMVDISQENLGLHRRSLEAIRELTADMIRLKRRLNRLATAKG